MNESSTLFREAVESVPPETRRFIDLSFNISDRLDAIMKAKGISKAELARMMHKTKPEVTLWLTGRHNFTLTTIAKIESVLGEHLLETT